MEQLTPSCYVTITGSAKYTGSSAYCTFNVCSSCVIKIFLKKTFTSPVKYSTFLTSCCLLNISSCCGMTEVCSYIISFQESHQMLSPSQCSMRTGWMDVISPVFKAPETIILWGQGVTIIILSFSKQSHPSQSCNCTNNIIVILRTG